MQRLLNQVPINNIISLSNRPLHRAMQQRCHHASASALSPSWPSMPRPRLQRAATARREKVQLRIREQSFAHEHAFHGQKFSGSSSAHEAATRPVHAPLGGHPHARGVITHTVGTQQPCPRLPLWGGHGHALGGKSRCMAEPETRGRIPVPVLSSPLWDSTRARGVITRAVGTR